MWFIFSDLGGAQMSNRWRSRLELYPTGGVRAYNCVAKQTVTYVKIPVFNFLEWRTL